MTVAVLNDICKAERAWATLLDVHQPEFDGGQVRRSIAANPHAALQLSRLLPYLESLSQADALIAESLAYGELQGGSEHAQWLANRPAAIVQPAGKVMLHRDGNRLSLIMDRPHSYNAIDRAMRDALYDAFAVAALDPEIECVWWRANGKAFSIGADLAEFGTTRDPAIAHQIRMQTLPAHMLVRCAHKLHVHIRGACIGAGLEMAAFAAHITATPSAWFQLPELAMGLIPGAGGCVSVPHRIGIDRTAWMVLSGKRIKAQTALKWGLIDAITES